MTDMLAGDDGDGLRPGDEVGIAKPAQTIHRFFQILLAFHSSLAAFRYKGDLYGYYGA